MVPEVKLRWCSERSHAICTPLQGKNEYEFQRPVQMFCRALLVLALSGTVYAQSYPSKPVRMILTYSGGIEAITRLVAARLTESLGQPVLVEGQADAGGSIVASTVAKAAPDGHTILSTTGSTQVQRGFLIGTAYDWR